ncbi:MAG: AmmeMemoRadiSam system radical SAM enzyme [Chloroflexi bacterium]|nr:AmmeMemoRadiSam system radical SAM enzyme [Chloroflexota bacterium]
MVPWRVTRRQFLAGSVAAGLASCLGLGGCRQNDESGPDATAPALHPARYFTPLDDGTIGCRLCFRKCLIREGNVGFCRNRKNVGGRLYSLVYGHPCAVEVDPIEKEPVFHMTPGARMLCVATASCNFRCKSCQNWEISQSGVWDTINYHLTPEQVVARALEESCDAISFTYSEPIAFYEYMDDIAVLAKGAGLRTVVHTNASLAAEPLQALLPHIDAVVVDLKGFTSEFYERMTGGQLEPVLSTLVTVARSGVHLEVVNLLIPSLNDDPETIRRMCAWLRASAGPDVPLHFLRFFPAYKLQRVPATPLETLEQAAAIASGEGLHYVYIGNVPGHDRNSTYCPRCGERVVHRMHFAVLEMKVKDGRCPACREPIPGTWDRGA